MELNDTVEMMLSDDWRERLRAEYWQLVILHRNLERMLKKWDNGKLNFKPACSRSLYELQLSSMADYITILEARAQIEGVEL